MNKAITLKLPAPQLDLIDAKASEQGLSRSRYIRSQLPRAPAENEAESPKPERPPKNNSVHVWLTAPERAQLQTHLSGADEPPSISSLMRQLLRQELGLPKLLTKEEINVLSDAVYQLRSIGRNLNQITTAINAGNCEALARLTPNYLDQISDRIDAVAHHTAAFVASALRESK